MIDLNRFKRKAIARNGNASILGKDIVIPKRKRRRALCQTEAVVEARKGPPQPIGLEAVRAAVIDYYENPQKYFDFTSMSEYYSGWESEIGEKQYIVKGRNLEAATGLVRLGSGHYSDVYEIDAESVVKIVKTRDKGYARFVSVIKDLDNPHFPKILGCEVWAGKTVYILERLSDTPASGEHVLKDHFRTAMKAAGNPFISFSDPVINSATQTLAEHKLISDLHDGNLMFRGDVPVITDPCSEGGENGT